MPGVEKRMALVLALAGAAISFLLPALAQQKDTVASHIDEQIVKKFDEAFNNGDAAAVAALYTEDAVQVTPQGPVFGREAIEKLFTGMFQQGHFSNHLNKDDQGSPHMIGTAGNEVWRTGEWSFTLQGKSGGPLQLKGYWGAVNVREGDTWKIRMLTFNVSPPPAATSLLTASPSNQ
jgi:ketosteroid isomerase-like protein